MSSTTSAWIVDTWTKTHVQPDAANTHNLATQKPEHTPAKIQVNKVWGRPGERTLGAPKTGGTRTVPIPNFLVKKLGKLIHNRHQAEYVFQTASGHPINDSNFRNRVWRQAQQAAGFATFIRVYDLRHLAATYAIQAGADVKAVQKMLGHASATITLDTYSHLFEQHHVTVADKISAARDEALNQ